MDLSCAFCAKKFTGKKKRKFCSLRCFGLSRRELIIEGNKTRRKYPELPGLTKLQTFRRFNPERYLRDLERDKDKRVEIIHQMGSKCAKCGYDKDIRALQIDHIRGDGHLDRMKKGRRKIYRYYVKNLKEAFDNLQILCANCNKIKQIEEKEHYKKSI